MLILSVSLAGFSARAESPSVFCEPDRLSFCVSPLKLGQVAPFDGQLLSTEAAIENTLKLENIEEKHKLALQHQADLAQLKLDYQSTIHSIDQDEWTDKETLYRDTIEKHDKLEVSFFHQQETWFGIGLLSGIALVVLSAWVLDKTQN